MARKLKSRGFTILAGTMVVAGPVAAACAPGPTYDDWAATDGAAGRINLDEVQDAFKKSGSPTEFEDKVNKIYEGDGLVLIRSSQDGDGLLLANDVERTDQINCNGFFKLVQRMRSVPADDLRAGCDPRAVDRPAQTVAIGQVDRRRHSRLHLGFTGDIRADKTHIILMLAGPRWIARFNDIGNDHAGTMINQPLSACST